MKKSGIWYVCFLVSLPLVLGGPTCTCPIKAMLAPKKTQPAVPATPAKSTTTRPVAVAPPATFADAVKRAQRLNKPIYVEFSANWCIPCRLYESTVLSSARGKEALRNVVFYHANVDKETDLAGRFGISCVPTGFLLKPAATGDNVTVLDRHVGTLSIANLETFLSPRG